MSSFVINISLEPYCATCLSQGRKMYPVKSYPPPFYMLIKNYILTGNDKLCWECHNFVRKMEAFRQRGLRAQACLAAVLNRQPAQLQSLSKLRTARTAHLDIPNIPPEDMNTQNFIEINTFKSEKDLFNVTEEPLEFVDAGVANNLNQYKVETDDNGASDINMANIANFQVFQHQAQNVSKSNFANTSDGIGSIANASLASLLNRKRPEPPFTVRIRPKPSKGIEIEIPAASSKEIDVEVPAASSKEVDGTDFKIRLPYKSKNNTKEKSENTSESEQNEENNEKDLSVTPPVPFTEERLTEEELAKWREGKRQNEFYAKSISVFRCDKCVEPFFFRPSFKAHQKMHTELYGELTCDVCQIRCINEDTLKAHREKHYRLLKCGYCPFKWDNLNSMRQHCGEYHKVPVKVYSCEICLQEMPSRAKLLRHLNNHCTVVCPECGIMIKHNTYKAHMRLHSRGPEKPYSCECGSKFHTKELLKSHMKRHNKPQLDENAFCIECNVQFQSVQSYRYHMTRSAKHASKEVLSRFQCAECGQGFPSRSILRDHTESKHSDLRKYSCESCSESFHTRNKLLRHKRKHEGHLKVKDKICDYCGKAFGHKKVLEDHINSHTGARPYKCHLCGDTFGHKSARYLHLRFKHKVPKKTTKND